MWTIRSLNWSTQTLTFYNDPIGGVEIIKIDANDSSERIPDVTFEIRKIDDELIDTITTDKNGRAFLALEDGAYYAVEIEAADGYQLDDAPHYFEIEDGKTVVLKVENKGFSGIIIHKVDSVTGEGIYDVKFLLYDANKNPIGEYTTDQNGYIYIDEALAEGKGRFYIRELEAAEGYELDEEYKTVYVKPGHTIEIEWENVPITGQIQIYKYAEEYNAVTGTPAGSPLEGATFEIVQERSGRVVYQGEAYFADRIFHLSDDQKELADNYAQNLSLFLGDGMFQYSEGSDSIPSLGTIRFTDGATEVVYYNQLDDRYADEPYGTDDIGGYGCGPTSMAIVVSSLTNDTVDPIEMAEWAYQNGYWCSKSGSYHSLIPGAAKAWGLPVEGCTASEPQRIVDALSQGKLVVALMTKGHFTSSGHFIVLRGVQDDKILVADPASYNRSQKAWDLSIILNEASRRAGSGGPFWIIG